MAKLRENFLSIILVGVSQNSRMKNDQTPKDEIHRDELYRLLWKKPAAQIAKDYDISGPLISKICRELDIPKPKVGHWSKVAHGKKIRRPALPKLKEGGKEIWKINRDGVQHQKEIARKQKEAPSIETTPDVERILSADLDEHKWVKTTRSASKEERYGRDKRLYQLSDRNHFIISTSKEHLERALAFLNRLIHLAESEGLTIEVKREKKPKESSRWDYREPRKPCKEGMFQWAGEQVGFRIFEKFRRTERPTNHSWKQYDFHPTGILEFTLNNTCGCAERSSWKDGKRHKIEDFYLQIVGVIKDAAAAKKEYLTQRQIEEERQRKINAMVECLRRQKCREDNAFERIQKEASKLAKAERIRSYADSAERRFADRFGPDSVAPDSDIGLWLQWIRIRADWIDPLTKCSQPWKEVVSEIIRLEERESRW